MQHTERPAQPALARSITITAIIPARNEATRVGAVVRSILPLVDEILVIDDASTDATAAEAASAGARVVRQATRGGYVPAIRRGFREAHGSIVVTIDADGEIPADIIPDLVAPIANGSADVVQGRRPHAPRWSEKFLSWLANVAAPVGDTGTGARALRADVARSLKIEGACICGTMALEAYCLGARLAEVPLTLRPIGKRRAVAWNHFHQFLVLLPWIVRAWAHGRRRHH